MNISATFDDGQWAKWCGESTLLLLQHLQRLKANERVARQVLQKMGGDQSTRLNKLIEMCPAATGIKEEPGVAEEAGNEDAGNANESPRSSGCGRISNLSLPGTPPARGAWGPIHVWIPESPGVFWGRDGLLKGILPELWGASLKSCRPPGARGSLRE